MADAPAPAAADAAPAPTGDIFSDYNPHGALGDLFAPAYIKGFAPSEKAVGDWSAAHRISDAQIEATRMPGVWQAPVGTNPLGTSGGMGPYGAGRIPQNISFGDQPQGMVDPAALKAATQGSAYDFNARRDAIASRIASNQQASDSYAQQHLARYGFLPGTGQATVGWGDNYTMPAAQKPLEAASNAKFADLAASGAYTPLDYQRYLMSQQGGNNPTAGMGGYGGLMGGMFGG